MAKKPDKVSANGSVERAVHIPGWAYNFMIDQAAKQRRDVKTEISILLEQAIREAMKQAETEPGQWIPAPSAQRVVVTTI